MESAYLLKLNPPQKEAVLHTEGPLMIIAGAGSGKTRVITYRIAYLIEQGVNPFEILALTFTNKAAKEMRNRISEIVGPEAKNLWMGTFHSVCAKILRIEADHIGYPTNFTIYDTDDSKSLIKSILKEMNLNDKVYTPNFVYGRISSAKNNLISYQQYMQDPEIQANDYSSGRKDMGQIYKTYVQRCEKAGAMDFDDLLYKTNVLFKINPEVLYKYQNKFKYVMVDEYQDTNFSQYLIVKKIAAIHQNIAVVGDDAQSIYAFRGANIQNILNFSKDYPDVKTVKLEQNYRSTQNIVNLANTIISKNKNQLKKNVFSSNDIGEKIKVIKAFSDNDEGKQVTESIIQEKGLKGLRNHDFAILYRTNAQSRSLEEALRKQNVNYKIYGGLSFYQRKEIKDLIAYFRLTVNHNDEEALKRIINYPARGIGATSINNIIVKAGELNVGLWEIVEKAGQHLGGKGAEKIEQFAMMIKSFAELMKSHNAYEIAEYIGKQSTLFHELYSDKSVEGVARYENITELLNGIKEFSENETIEDHSLGAFLQDVALLTGDENADNKDEDHVSLMTIHTSKGLEFKNVYVVGLEENLFPSQLSTNSLEELEEERRLFYVACTRAENKLTLSFATSRYKYGSLQNCEPSRFLDELDKSFLEETVSKRPSYEAVNFDKEKNSFNSVASIKASRPTPSFVHQVSDNFIPNHPNEIQLNHKVEHQKFGFGIIKNIEGNGDERKAVIQFDKLGDKQLLLKFAKLKIVE
jgi:DNA helicase II / ATP-dependent DNA helicase PcrA